ncbi:MAG: UvrD-helicase domain-containing protein [Tannerellaceae bacterium]|jgi:DNA helicase-2/ATP-dependent DNA helicase PcrA|nr:UvrD-helicase domain-containing protein [Tannerellaceae bacterium]
MDFLNHLNKSQQEAVLYIDGPALVIAGAGSGKTRVLTYKIAYLLAQGWSPYNILALTFTNKAAREMKERISTLAEPRQARALWMGTFHSIFSRILRKECARLGYPADFTIYDSDDSKSLIRTIIKEMSLDEKLYRSGAVQSRISQAKNALVTSESYGRNKEIMDQDMRSKMPYIRDIYVRYQARCYQAGAMDFDDLLLQTNILFRDHPDVLNDYGNIFRYILVDEYQDTNFAQYLIVQKLAQKHNRLCVVGDDAQSIYSFRGANIDNILKFKNQHPDCKIFKLEHNYRSTQNIVNIANSLISKNSNQIHKKVYSEKEEGAKIKLLAAYSDHEEAYTVGAKIIELRMFNSGKFAYRDFAVLYRTNAQSRVLEEAFRKRSIPYRVYGGMSFYQRKEVKDVMAYLRLTVNPDDEEALKRIINFPARGIGETTIGKLSAAAAANNVSIRSILNTQNPLAPTLNKGTWNKLAAFNRMLERFADLNRKTPLNSLVEVIINESGLAQEFAKDDSVENQSRRENVQELVKSVQDYADARLEEDGASNVTLSDYLSEVALYTDQDNEAQDSDKVMMMTVHASKGLEFKNVLITGLEEELFPSSRSRTDPKAIEEERRLFYVAITRAQENCILTYAQNRFHNGMSGNCRPSRFLADLDPAFLDIAGDNRAESRLTNVMHSQSTWKYESRPMGTTHTAEARNDSYKHVNVSELQVGMDVIHERFGNGTIVELSIAPGNESATIDFGDFGVKRLILKFAYLRIP